MTIEADRYTLRLAEHPRWTGPIAGKRLRKSLAILAILWLAGLAAVLTDAPEQLTAFTLSLALPGGGLFYMGHWALFAAGVVLFVWSLFMWWAAGPVVLPIFIWLALAAVSASHRHDHVPSWSAVAALAIPLLLAACAITAQAVRFRDQVRRGRDIDARLARETFTRPTASAIAPVSESSPEDLASLRYALDLALQPLDTFDGFTKIDQFREAALRYQLNSLGYALATSQYSRTPAFTGYLAEAQRNAITKMLDKRVWGYWAIENLWGNLRWNPDPVNWENVMLTGFFGVQVGMYESLNDDRYSRPGALTFEWNDRRSYRNSLTTLAESVHRNMRRSDWTLYPCEPNWTYTVCNTFGLNTMLIHDRLHGTQFAEEVAPGLRHAYDTEFTRPDGRIVGVRCERLGVSWNLWAGPVVQLTTAFWLNAGMPELAQRTWWIVRDQEIHDHGDRVGFAPSVTSRLDPGNYRLGNDAYGQAMIAMAAREMGDDATAARAIAGLEDSGNAVTTNGARRYSALSTLGNLYALQSRFNRANGLHDLINRGAPAEWRTGPILAEAAYPDVLVAKAVTDGHALDLVLRPGAGPCRTTLRLERLVPHRDYRVSGAVDENVGASATGAATVIVDLHDRLEVSVVPDMA